MDEVVKMTVRLPSRLHKQLRRQARRSHRSLNSLIVEALWRGARPTETNTEADDVRQVLVQGGLWAPPGSEWSDLVRDAPDVDRRELRKQLEAVPSLSDIIIEERGPR